MGHGDKKKNEPADGWKQADFKSVICLPTYKCYIWLLVLVCLVSFILTVIILAYSYQIIEAYSDEFTLKHSSESNTVNVPIKHGMNSPVYVYLIIKDFYQNHRIYLKSKSRFQLADKTDSTMSTNCSPYYYTRDYPKKQNLAHNETENEVLNPCGLLPNSFIDLSLQYSRDSNNFTDIPFTGISWKQDDGHKYVYQSSANINVTNEKFKNWMRTSATKTVQKLYGVIEEDLKSSSISIRYSFTSSSEVYFSYSPQVYFLLSTTTRIGGRNLVLGYYFLAITILSLIWIILFTYLDVVAKKNNR